MLATDPKRADPSTASAVQLVYQERQARTASAVSLLSARYARLVVLEIGLTILLGLGFYSSGGSKIVAGVGFLLLAVPAEWLRRTAAELNVQRKIYAYYHSRLERLGGAWAGTGDTGREFAPGQHAYCDDLDLFGEGSLFEYLCAAKTGSGREWLAQALLTPSDLPEVLARQQGTAEMRGQHELRESLAGAARTGTGSFEGRALADWLAQPVRSVPRALRIVTALLAAVNLTTVFWALAGKVSSDVPLLTLGLVGVVGVTLLRTLGPVIKAADPVVVYELELLRRYRRTLGSMSFQSSLLRRDLDSLRAVTDGEMKRLIRWVKLMRWHEEPAFAVISYLSLWGPLWAMAAEALRGGMRDRIRAASAAIGEIEGLSSLAAFSFEHPAYPFPSLVGEGSDEAPVFEATAMGHPLIAPSVCVRNPVSLDAGNRFVLVSGSNMSGKSTYLRAVGLNFVLARAGAPVCCDALRLNLFSLATCMRVHDSLQDGKSRFLAEVERVRRVLDQSSRERVLFLLDELLSGTNSEDRRAGAAGLVARLLSAGASGFLTTHDLALTELVFARPEIAKNVYFVDHLADKQMAFDYRLREGIVPHSNGAAILRTLGIL